MFKGWARRSIRINGGTIGALCGFGVVAPRQRPALRLHRPSNPYGVSLVSKVTLNDLLAAGAGTSPPDPDHGGAPAGSPARSRASRKTSSIIGGVSLPVNVSWPSCGHAAQKN